MELEKITEWNGRRYEDACGTAHALDLIGERWTMLVMRELMLGPRRFGDLRRSLIGLSANVLTQRLEALEAAGIVARTRLPPPASVQVYGLTQWGREAEPIILGLGRWGARSPLHDPTMPLSAVSMILSLRAMFDPARAAGISATITFRCGDEVFTAAVRENSFRAERGEIGGADAAVSGAPPVIIGTIYGFQDLDAMLATGALAIDGDRAAFDRFAQIFVLPAKAEI